MFPIHEASMPARADMIRDVSRSPATRHIEFDGLPLLINKHTLIPHSDTAQLIRQAALLLESNEKLQCIADVGTGSGVIAISLAKKFPERLILASDVSREALAVAKQNAALHNAGNIRFYQNTGLGWLSEYKGRTIDFIVSNPPFVGEEEFSSEEFSATYPEALLEPTSAIVTLGDAEGLSPYMEIIKNSRKNSTGLFIFQCNNANITLLQARLLSIGSYSVDITCDNSGRERFLLARYSAV